jgi:hypothetical protein
VEQSKTGAAAQGNSHRRRICGLNQVDDPQISQILADENRQSAFIREICG